MLGALKGFWAGAFLLPALACAQAVPPSLLDQPPAAPTITYSGGQLTVAAANSSLRAILDDLEKSTGVKVQGLAKDERIFGVYGPGKPQEVLSSLLDDSGYNVLISGQQPDGAPREIVLSTKPTGGVPAQTMNGQPTQASSEDGGDEGEEGGPPPPQPALFGPQSPGGPGGFPRAGQPIRTPQQMLEELQRLRQAQTSQQPPPQ